MQALLELDCIPSGMELFPAANEDQWTLIKKVIDDSDYYILVIGGRYGSLGPEGFSYTEMEYRYALETGKPTIAFLHKEPEQISAGKTEGSEEGRRKLAAFRDLASGKVCRFWTDPKDLGSQVSRSLIKLIKSTPAIGWVRADLVPDESAAQQMVQLHRKIEQLEAELAAAKVDGQHELTDLAHGGDCFTLHYEATAINAWSEATATCDVNVDVTWNDILGAIAPNLLDEATEFTMRAALNRLAWAHGKVLEDEAFGAAKVERSETRKSPVSLQDFDTVKIQLRALKFIDKSTKPRSVKDTETYWTLTKAGDVAMTELRAIRRSGGAVLEAHVD
ncbi:protein of unknown function [Ralstonia sp. 25mfcol4.1]|nr:protein of unknown function [Ralstonia sp. 25mfcol4.1]